MNEKMTLADVYNYLAHAYIELKAGNLTAGTQRVGILLEDLEKARQLEDSAKEVEPIGEIVRSFSTGSGLDVKFYKPLTSDVQGIVGTKLYAIAKEKDQ